MSQLQPLLEAGREFRAVAKLAGRVLHPEHAATPPLIRNAAARGQRQTKTKAEARRRAQLEPQQCRLLSRSRVKTSAQRHRRYFLLNNKAVKSCFAVALSSDHDGGPSQPFSRSV